MFGEKKERRGKKKVGKKLERSPQPRRQGCSPAWFLLREAWHGRALSFAEWAPGPDLAKGLQVSVCVEGRRAVCALTDGTAPRNPSTGGLRRPMSVCPSINGLGWGSAVSRVDSSPGRVRANQKAGGGLVAGVGVQGGVGGWLLGGGAVPLLCLLPTPCRAGLLTPPKATSGVGRREETGGWDQGVEWGEEEEKEGELEAGRQGERPTDAG